MATNGSDGTGKGIVAERLDRLFAAAAPEGKPLLLREAADGINARAGERLVSVQYLSQLRNGDRKRPSFEVLRAIANWFGVSVYYFADAEMVRRTDEELRILALTRDPRARRVTFMTEDVGPDSLDLIISMLEMIRKADGLRPVGDGSEGERVVPPQRGSRPDASARGKVVPFYPLLLPPGIAGRGAPTCFSSYRNQASRTGPPSPHARWTSQMLPRCCQARVRHRWIDRTIAVARAVRGDGPIRRPGWGRRAVLGEIPLRNCS